MKSPRFHVDVLEIVLAAQRAGFSLGPRDVRTAEQRGDLVPLQRAPRLLFTVDEANRWLTAWTRATTRRTQERRR